MRTTLVQITDTHIHDQAAAEFKGSRPLEYLQRILRHIQYFFAQPDALIITGDITHDGGADACHWLQRALHEVPCPVYVTPGNHDEQTVIEQHLLNDHITMPDRILLNNWQLLFADSHLDRQTHGHINEQRQQQLLERLQDAQPTILFTHHPPLSIRSRWMDEIGMDNGEQLLEALSRYPQLAAVVFGHIHQCWDSRRQALRLLGTPSTCIQFTPLSDEFGIDDRDPGYRVIQLDEHAQLHTWVMRCGMRLTRIISGGQSGVDRAALDSAMEWAIPHGGWCPKGRLAIDGIIDAKYQLTETPSTAYPQRTEWNVRDSDATLILSWGPPDGGTALTASLARQMNKPLHIVDLLQPPPVADIWRWLNRYKVAILNIAGPRHSKHEGIYDAARNYLDDLFGWHLENPRPLAQT